MAAPALSSCMLNSPSMSRLGPSLASRYGEHLGLEATFWRSGCQRHGIDDPQKHGLYAALSQPVTEASPSELSKRQDNQTQVQSRGGGGRKLPKVRQKSENKIDTSSVTSKLEWLKEEGIDLNSKLTISRVNRVIGLCSSVTEALEVIEEMKVAGPIFANEGTYLALITVCKRQKQGERALTILEAMKQAGVKPGILTYNTLISCCQQSLRLEDAFRIKTEMENAEVLPDVVTYTSLMASLVRANPYRGRSSPAQRLQKVMDLYKEMLDRNVKPDVVTFNTILYAGSMAKLPGKVLDTYRLMIAEAVSPNQVTFGLLLEALGAGGRLKSALEIFDQMKAAGISPVVTTYNSLIEACAAAPQPNAKKAWVLFEEMKNSDNVTPNAATFMNLIAASSKGGDHCGAMKAYEQLLLVGYSDAKTTSTFNKLIHSASMAESLESAFQIYEKMRVEGLKADVVTYNTLLSACVRADDIQRALVIHEDFNNLGIHPNQATLHTLIGAFGKADRWQDAVKSFQSLKTVEEPLTVVSYSIVFGACFGKDGIDGFLAGTATNGLVQLDPGIEAAIELYNEAVVAGLYNNYNLEDLSRCVVSYNSRAAIIISLLAWLKAIQDAPPTTDLQVDVGTFGVKEPGKPGKGKVSWKYTVAKQTLQRVGLQSEQISTETVQGLTVRSQTLKAWLTGNLEAGKADSASIE